MSPVRRAAVREWDASRLDKWVIVLQQYVLAQHVYSQALNVIVLKDARNSTRLSCLNKLALRWSEVGEAANPILKVTESSAPTEVALRLCLHICTAHT